MATLKEDDDSWAASGIIRRDFRHSHDGPEEMPHRRKRRGKGHEKPRGKGCPARKGEDSRAHVYVWIEYFGKEWSYYGAYPTKRDVHWYDKVCVGCGHKGNRIYDWGWEFLSR